MRSIENPTRKSKPLRAAGLLLGWASLALLPFAAAGCNHKEAAASEEKSNVVEVATTRPVRKDLTHEVQQPGYLRPYEMTPIYTKIAGFAEEPIYDIGDRVKKGDLLVALYVPEVKQDLLVKKAKVKQAMADLKAAEARKEAAAADVDAKRAAIKSAEAQVIRWQAEDERGLRLVLQKVFDQQTHDEIIKELRTSEAKRDEATANFRSSQANLTRASADIEVAAANIVVTEAARDQWRDWLAYAQITAPFDGVVTDRRVHSGHFLQPANSGSTSKAAEPLFVMMRMDIMRCTVDVPELDALLVRRGDKAIVRFQAIPGAETIGVVTRTTKALDEHSRTLRVEVHLKNPTGATVGYSAGADGVISAVQPTPLEGGSGYPPNATIPLQILTSTGRGGIVNATTDAAGVVVGYALKSGGTDYASGSNVTGSTLAEGELRPNMYANVTILPMLRNSWVLPPDAVSSDILNNLNSPYCFVVEAGKAHKVLLQIGARCNEGLQVLRKQRVGQNAWEEITGQEVIATTNTKALEEGQEVRIQAVEAH